MAEKVPVNYRLRSNHLGAPWPAGEVLRGNRANNFSTAMGGSEKVGAAENERLVAKKTSSCGDRLTAQLARLQSPTLG